MTRRMEAGTAVSVATGSVVAIYTKTFHTRPRPSTGAGNVTGIAAVAGGASPHFAAREIALRCLPRGPLHPLRKDRYGQPHRWSGRAVRTGWSGQSAESARTGRARTGRQGDRQYRARTGRGAADRAAAGWPEDGRQPLADAKDPRRRGPRRTAAALFFLRGQAASSARATASPISTVEAVPPMSRVRSPPSPSTRTHRGLDGRRRRRLAEPREHHGRGQDGADRIRDPRAPRCPAPSRARARTSTDAGASGSRFALGARPRPPVTVAVISDRMSPKRFEATITSKLQGRRISSMAAASTRIDAGLDLRELRRHLAEDARPRSVMLWPWALDFVIEVTQRRFCVARQLEGEADDALGAAAGEHGGLHRDLGLGAPVDAAADLRVLALGVLAHEDDVDRPSASPPAAWPRRGRARSGARWRTARSCGGWAAAGR